MIRRYQYIPFILVLLCISACTAKRTSFSPCGVYQDNDALLVSSSFPNQLLRLSMEGEILCCSEAMEGRINDVVRGQNQIAVICGTFNGELILLDTNTLKQTLRVVLGHTPSAIIEDPKRDLYWITLRHEQQLLGVDRISGKKKYRLPIGREAIGLHLHADGERMLVAYNLPQQSALAYPVAASVDMIHLPSGKRENNLVLPNGSTDVKDIIVEKSGRYAYVGHLLARYQLPTNQVERGWMSTNCLSIIDLDISRIVATIVLDTPQRGAANPWDLALNASNNLLFVALAGSDEILVLDREKIHERLTSYEKGHPTSYSSSSISELVNDASFLHGIRSFIPANGKGCRSILSTENGLIVGNYFTGNIQLIPWNNELSSVNEFTNSIEQVTLISSSRTLMDTRIGRGEMYFHDATLCFQQWQSCASCHPNDARMDGMNWDLQNDGIGNLKNTKSLLFAHETPPAMITGIRADAETAVRSGFKHIHFAQVKEEICEDVDAYLQSLSPLRSPYLQSNGELTMGATEGKKHFEKYCIQCHAGKNYTDMQQYQINWAIDSEKGRKMDTPTLRELWRTAPYLYDGRSYTLKEMLTIHGPQNTLSQKQMMELEAYLLSI